MNIDRRNFIGVMASTGGALILPRHAFADTNLDAPVPAIQSVNQVPPARSAPIVLATKPGKRMLMFANSDNSSSHCYVSDVPDACAGQKASHGAYGKLLNYWDGAPAANYTLTLRQFWRLVNGSYTTLPAGNSLTQTFTHSWGVSTTDSETISATLGYSSGDAAGLNASVSDTFSHSVTTDQEQSTSISRQINPPADGSERVWMMWQLVHEIVALDPSGHVVSGGDRGGDNNRKAEIRWPNGSWSQNNCPNDGYDSGAWVYYTATLWEFPSTIMRPSQKDFPV